MKAETVSFPTTPPATSHPKRRELEELTGQIVGRVFLGTLLAQMRSSSFKGKYGHGGRGEEVFAGQLDGIIAERAGGSLKSGLGKALLNHLAKQQDRLQAMSPKEESA